MQTNKFKEKKHYKLRKLSDSIEDINKRFLYKFGKLDYIIHLKWSEIVGPYLFQYSEPIKITSRKNAEDQDENSFENYLQVNVTPSIAIEFQHFETKIVEKINSFFGYKAVNRIKIHQKLIAKKDFSKKIDNKNKKKNYENLKKIKNTTLKINDKELGEALTNLGMSISEEKK